MACKPAPGTRDRILDTAARRFYDRGIHAVGQQQDVDECGCGKNLLYLAFSSKDELVVAYLERRRQDWAANFARTTEPLADDPAGQLVAMVRAAMEAVAPPPRSRSRKRSSGRRPSADRVGCTGGPPLPARLKKAASR